MFKRVFHLASTVYRVGICDYRVQFHGAAPAHVFAVVGTVYIELYLTDS